MRVRSLCGSLLVLAALAAAPALAENLSDLPLSSEGPPIDHGDDALDDALHGEPDPQRVDTVLVFTNVGLAPAGVRCVAFDRAGEVVGHAHALVPARGARHLLASDFGGDRRFAGHVQCGTPGRLVGSAFLLAPGGPTDAPAKQADRPGRGELRIVFPAVASF
jgi:hypothetical protein